MKELEELLAYKLNQRSELTMEILSVQNVLVMLKKENEETKRLVEEAQELINNSEPNGEGFVDLPF